MERTGKAEAANLCYGREDEANSRSQDLRSKGGVGKDGGKRGVRHEGGDNKTGIASRRGIYGRKAMLKEDNLAILLSKFVQCYVSPLFWEHLHCFSMVLDVGSSENCTSEN